MRELSDMTFEEQYDEEIFAMLKTLHLKLNNFLSDIRLCAESEFPDVEKQWIDDNMKGYQQARLPIIDLDEAIERYVKARGLTLSDILGNASYEGWKEKYRAKWGE